MRKALNENPMVQLGVLGVGLLLLGVMLFSTVLKGEETPEPAASTADPAAATATPPVEGESPAPPAEAAPPPATPSGSEPDRVAALEPSKGLPDDVVRAYAADRPFALLVIDPKAVADEQLEEWIEILSARRGLETFVVKTKDIVKYARITQGAAVSSTPALVMVRPRKLTGNVPTAIVSTGFEGPRSLEQALDDALYKGRERTPSEAHP